MSQRHKCVVKLQYGQYTGEETVICDENDDNHIIIAQAWRQLFKRAGGEWLSMASTSAKVLEREPIYDEE